MLLRRLDLLALAAGACVCVSAAAATAETMTFPIDVDTAVDSRDPTCNFGVSTSVKVVVNGDDGSLARALFALPDDPWAVPSENVTSARVWFYTWRNMTGDRTVRLSPLIRDFAAGTGDRTVSDDGATWQTYDGAGAWTSAGGDYEPNLWVDAVELAEPVSGGWFYWDITVLWNEPPLRAHGALLRMADESDPGSGNMPRAAFTSSDGPADERPYLELTVVPEPSSLAILAGMGIMLAGLAGRHRNRQALSGTASAGPGPSEDGKEETRR